MFDDRIIRKLQKFRLESRRLKAGVQQGERRSKRRGLSNEFADYRAYVPGDDIRRIDWNIYARHNRPYLRLYEDEQSLEVQILLDGSASMGWGEGAENKLRYGRILAAAVGIMALSGGDRCQVHTVRDDRLTESSDVFRNRGSTPRLLAYLDAQTASGTSSLSSALSAFGQKFRQPALVFILSDLLSEDGVEEGLRRMYAVGHETVVVQILTEDELTPTLNGELQLEDIETGRTREITVDESVRAAYRKRIASWQSSIRTFCRRRGIRYLPASTHSAWEALVTRDLRQNGVVR